jgi:hypothetical protein
MFQRFTERARRVIAIAQEEARILGQAHVGTEHLLVGLLRETEGLAGQVLHELGVNAEAVRGQLAAATSPAAEDTRRRLPLTAPAKAVLEKAVRQALSLGHDFIGTEHLLLGLLCVPESDGARILARADVSYEAARAGIALRGAHASKTQATPGGPEDWSRTPLKDSRDPREAMLQRLARQRPAPEMSSIRVLKERARADRRVYAVTFASQGHEQQLWLAEVERADDGCWHSRSGSGGPRPAPRRDGRWIYLEGWSQDDRFCLGGELLVGSAQAREARLALADGTELVDDLAGGVVLFLDDRPLQHPAIVRVYDGHGAMLASHPAF